MHIYTYHSIYTQPCIYIHIKLCIYIPVGENNCEVCDPSTPTCRSDLVCNPATYRCECPTDEVQIGDKCCKYSFF